MAAVTPAPGGLRPRPHGGPFDGAARCHETHLFHGAANGVAGVDKLCPTHGNKSKPRSAGMELWVRAPMEMRSTPVSAMAARVLRVTPPEASSGSLPATRPT